MTEIFKVPTQEQLREACTVSELKLTDIQVRDLERVICRAHADLNGIICSTIPTERRNDVLKKFRNFDKALTDLMSALDVTSRDVEYLEAIDYDILDPVNVRAGAILTQAVAGERRRKPGAVGQTSEVAFEALALVTELIAVKRAVNELLTKTVSDKGGRNPDIVRHFLVAELIRSAETVLGHAAVATENKPFMLLVNTVFSACGLAEAGSDKIVQRSLKSLGGGR